MLGRAARRMVFVAALVPMTGLAEEPVDLAMVTRVRDEGFHRSQVMDTLAYLTDVIGPRLTGSPEMKRANDWTRDRLAQWGLANAHLEAYSFGRGWSLSRVAVHMLRPRETPLIALPKGWSAGTRKPVRGLLHRVEIQTLEDLDRYRGQLAGKILLMPGEGSGRDPLADTIERYTADHLAQLAEFPIPGERGGDRRQRFAQRWQLFRRLNGFLAEEKVLATLEPSSWDGGPIRVGGFAAFRREDEPGVPALVVATEQFAHLERLLARGEEVELEVEVKVRFHDEDPMAYNTLAEIPGGGRGDELVMVGAHLDSWHVGSGAADNAAGCAVAMEAVRILQALGVEPRRTIRIALWSGEEQGILGSRAYVAEHFAARPEPQDPEQKELPPFLRRGRGPLEVKPDHARLSLYLNLDNGGGQIRGIYAEENAAVRPIFQAWLDPFADLGANTVALRRTGGTDHTSFDRVGLPGFQFIQDPLDYFTHTHHTHLDVYDRVRREDLMQASVVLASFLYHAAMRDEMLPRKPMPREESEAETATAAQ